jgi:predicted amidophosphoribosyltransferase
MDVEIELGKLDVMKEAAKNQGALGGLMGAGLGLGVGANMAQSLNSLGSGTTTAKNTVVCPSCGRTVAAAKFCSECGKPLPGAAPADGSKFCPECGAKIPANSKFCPECGKRF